MHFPSYTPPSHNTTLLTAKTLPIILDDLSMRLLRVFGQKVRLVIHGGAALLLHSGIPSARPTRDVDFLGRAFDADMLSVGRDASEARKILRTCIKSTARQFGLGKDWMNCHADCSLPMATFPASGRVYDPITTKTFTPHNVQLYTVFMSNGLDLISIPPYWTVALKLMRYNVSDVSDITAVLLHGTRMNGTRWSSEILETWLTEQCGWAMGYASYSAEMRKGMQVRITHAVRKMELQTVTEELNRRSSAYYNSTPSPVSSNPWSNPAQCTPAPRHSVPPTNVSTPHTRRRAVSFGHFAYAQPNSTVVHPTLARAWPATSAAVADKENIPVGTDQKSRTLPSYEASQPAIWPHSWPPSSSTRAQSLKERPPHMNAARRRTFNIYAPPAAPPQAIV